MVILALIAWSGGQVRNFDWQHIWQRQFAKSFFKLDWINEFFEKSTNI
jgi:hypothetical protein